MQVCILRLSVVLFFALMSVVHAYEDGDGELWFKLSADGRVVNDVRAFIEAESRFGESMEYYEQHVFPAVKRPVSTWLAVRLGCDEIFIRVNRPIFRLEGGSQVPVAGHYWKGESRPTLDLTFHRVLEGWKIEDRVRCEYRIRESAEDAVRYRNRIKVAAPWKWTEVKATPYVAWEANYSMETPGPAWNRHRYYLGIGTRLSERTKVGVYYCFQRDRTRAGWSDLNVTGLTMGLVF